MEFTSAPLHKAQVSWRGLLLTVSLLTYWTAAEDITLEAVPPIVAVGSSVFLHAYNVPNFITCNWYREEQFKRYMISINIRKQLFDYGKGYQGKVKTFENCSLHIKNVNKDDAGGYKILVNVDDSNHLSQYVEFQVYYPVTKPSIQVNKTIGMDLVSVFLKCLSRNIDNSINWFFKGQSLSITNRMRLAENNSILQIFPARREDSGDYQCEVSNPLGSKTSDPLQLDVIEPVTKPSIQFTNTTVKDLTSVILKCLSNDTGISIHWLFKGQSLRIGNMMRLSQNNSTLEIVPARSSHSGDYQCEVSNQVSSQRSDPIQVDIIDPVSPPSIQVTNNTVKVLTSVFLNCLSNDTGISIHWLFKGQSVELTDRMKLSQNNSTLQIDSARIEDSGDYQCEVSNQVSSKRSDPIQLDIVDPVTLPSIQVTNNTFKDMISVFLTCLSNNTGISVHWLFKGQSVELSDRIKLSHNNSTLQIDSVRIEDSGDYQCEVSNQVSSMRSNPIQLDIIVEHRPSLWGIIGIVAQCLMGLIAVIFLLFILWRRRRGREPQNENDIKQVDNEPSNLNETSKAASKVKPKMDKKPKGKK